MLTLGLAQVNPVVGDLDYNLALMRRYLAQARAAGVQMLLFPELVIAGYPPEDLLLRRAFLADCRAAVDEFATDVNGLTVVAGYPERAARRPYNSLAVIADGAVRGTYRKCHLPNYGVFDEDRYFTRGSGAALARVDGLLCGLSICEDIWYSEEPMADEAAAGAQLILNISASPYHAGKGRLREAMLAQRARDHVAAIAYCNLVGGQDELVFDGQSLVFDHRGRVLARAGQFTEELLVCDIDCAGVLGARLHDTRGRQAPERPVPIIANVAPSTSQGPGHIGRRVRVHDGVEGRLQSISDFGWFTVIDDAGESQSYSDMDHYEMVSRVPVLTQPAVAPVLSDSAEVYQALVLGVGDYVYKNGFEHVALGLSGGIDSALVALVAVDALGPEKVTCVVMPSDYSSSDTQEDARTLASNLGCELRELPIAGMLAAYERSLAGEFAGIEADVTEENLQARIRGNLLMALSNKFGWLVLSTGNKSEMSVGFTTLYGDMVGGLAVIKDVPKTLVFELVRWRNRRGSPVPAGIITRPPSAELKPGQQDTDSLPPYEVLDPILERHVENDESVSDVVGAGFDPEVVEHVARLVDTAEYKRRQGPPGIKVTTRAFGRDRRMPITNRYGQLPQRARRVV